MNWTPPLPASKREQRITIAAISIMGAVFLVSLVGALVGGGVLWVAASGGSAWVLLRLVVAHVRQEKL